MVNEQRQDGGRRPANQRVRDVIPDPNKINAATPFDFSHVARWILTILRTLRERVWEAANVKLEVLTIDTDLAGKDPREDG